MDANEVEESFFAPGDAKLHGEMCNALSAIYCRIMSIFPSLEDARPRSKSGIQALCSLHVVLEKVKNILRHCTESSKLYLAITGDSVVLKFEKAKTSLLDSLRRVEDIVQQSIASQILEIITELENTQFSLDPSEKEVGDQIIGLLQQGGNFESSSENNNELEVFHQAATRLGITSSRAALTERRCLKKLIERARMEEDKRKESIVAYLLHLMRKYSKLFRSEIWDDNDSQGSSSLPCSPTVQGSLDDPPGRAFDRQLSKLSSFNFRPCNNNSNNRRCSVQMSVPPDELRCPISLQLMYDPVIIASGQTYERLCIEKWFSDGHSTCPKTQQQLSHLCLTPNYCVKALISSWCEQNGVQVPDGPPESLDLNYWRLALSVSESSGKSVGSCKFKDVKVVPLEESGTIKEESCELEYQEEAEVTLVERCSELLTTLSEVDTLRKKCRVVEQMRVLLKDDEEARILMGENGCVEALLQFLGAALIEKNDSAQNVGAMALFNLAVDNNRNKELMLVSGIIPLLEEMLCNPHSHGSVTALYLNLSCLEDAKPIIGSSLAVPFMVNLLWTETETQCKVDALHALYHLSTYPPNIPCLLSADIVNALQSLTVSDDQRWTEKSLAVLLNLVSNEAGKDEMVSVPGLVSNLATILDTGEANEQEQAVSLLLVLCKHSEICSQMVLQEGVIPSLVSISVNGTQRGRERAQKLLTLFRELRQRDQTHLTTTEQHVEVTSPQEGGFSVAAAAVTESKPQCKSASRKRMGRAFSFLWKSKSFSVYQC
ncbi:U-box domain-containing protein 45 [Raphanus sativus]|uniref:RING-type E3 ubiquitin transferase n=1 Tax=Raphanus sativus TaxID=3726 RepID=A0A9W3D029_RAPSA|nr:U-box domain-containing protein 45-like [Raphanus sativus]KAJ4866792.1 U-box domain-containing protein 45 [Raphanus sativus]